jgi:hypothetical protein
MNRYFARDEREQRTDLAADRVGFLVLSFGLLAIVAYRSVALGVASWDLLGLLLVSGIASAVFRLWQRTLTRQAALVLLLVAGVGLVVAAVVALGTGA